MIIICLNNYLTENGRLSSLPWSFWHGQTCIVSSSKGVLQLRQNVFYNKIKNNTNSIKFLSYHTPQPIGNGQNIFKLLSSSISPQPQDGVGQITPWW
jgi:hypothetical protein